MDRFEIYSMPVRSGLLGLAQMPGRHGDFAGDLERIMQWRPAMVISMTTSNELEAVGAHHLGRDLQSRAITWVHLPVQDFGAPSSNVRCDWPNASTDAHRVLSAGGRVLVHCRGGCGRSGMIVLRLLVEGGEAPDKALRRLRAVRPCAVETDAQMAWATAPASTGL
ncbi:MULTISPECIES: dual specificity protein phosphatase family protein [unclassified Ruegeria]|uniref:protein-tyrosine phosphatase family protein n=1 Tax=unclassified Ruegeria TaxID=2625375 RepID=UPI0020C4B4E1|nr:MULTISPECIES: dual specificity protein phosphatase family protein [unclassified Ruegeria]